MGDVEVKPDVWLRPLAPSEEVMQIPLDNVSGLYVYYDGYTPVGFGRVGDKGDGWMSHHLLVPFSKTAQVGSGITLTGYALRSSMFINAAEPAVRSWYHQPDGNVDEIWRYVNYGNYEMTVLSSPFDLYHSTILDGGMGGTAKLVSNTGSGRTVYAIDGQASIFGTPHG